MPGSSLWLVPPPTHPLHKLLSTLITETLPARFPAEAGAGPGFSPHMTLTSEISPSTYGDDGYVGGRGVQAQGEEVAGEEKRRREMGQAWLDSLPLPPADRVRVRLVRVETQDFFFRRCFARVALDGVREVVAVARAWGVNGEQGESTPKTDEWLSWWRDAFGPHVSLIYGQHPISEDKLEEISGSVTKAGVSLSGSEEPSSIAAGEEALVEDLGGWEGGVVWLVPTDRSIAEWKPIATRTL